MPASLPTLVRSLAPFLGALAFALAMHLFVYPNIGDFASKLTLDIGINIILAVSLTMVNGFTGQFSIGHAAFMAVGGYTAASIVYYASMLIWGDAMVHGGALSSMIPGREAPFVTPADGLFLGALLVGGLFAAGCGYLVGLPSLRLRGDYLAIVTLGFGEIVRVLIQSQTGDVLYTVEEVRDTPLYMLPTKVGGALGFSGLPFYTSLFWVYLFVCITLLVACRLKYAAVGRAFLSIREDEIAAEAMGVDTTKFKVRAFVIAAFFAGIAGGLFAHAVGTQLNPQELGFQKSFDIIIMVVLGGLGSISGAAIAAAIVTLLPELLRNPDPIVAAWPWIAGILAAATVASIVARFTGRRARPFVTTAIVFGALLGLTFLAAWAGHNGIDLGNYRMIFFALALIIMMIARPQGIFGVGEVWDRSLWMRIASAFMRADAPEGSRR